MKIREWLLLKTSLKISYSQIPINAGNRHDGHTLSVSGCDHAPVSTRPPAARVEGAVGNRWMQDLRWTLCFGGTVGHTAVSGGANGDLFTVTEIPTGTSDLASPGGRQACRARSLVSQGKADGGIRDVFARKNKAIQTCSAGPIDIHILKPVFLVSVNHNYPDSSL